MLENVSSQAKNPLNLQIDMKKPTHQILITYFLWLLAGFLAFGTFLDALANAISLITPSVALAGTVSIICLLIFVQLYLGKKPLGWVANGSSVKISKLNLGLLLPFIGMILLLWFPSLFNRVNGSEQTINSEVFPVVDLSEPIEEQVQLFATDKVEIIADPDFLKEVWFGEIWEPYEPDKEYTVWGYPKQPVTPKFRFEGEGRIKMHIRISVQYSENLNKPRDIR